MRISMRWVGLSLVGAMTGLASGGEAQGMPVTWPSLVGAWAQTNPQGSREDHTTGMFQPDGSWKIDYDTLFSSLRGVVGKTLTFRSDSVWFETVTRTHAGDTISCTTKYRGYLSGDTLFRRTWAEENHGKQAIVLPNPNELSLSNDFNEIYRRLPAPAGPVRDYFASRWELPASGPLAALVGTWERDLNKDGWKAVSDASLVRETFVIRSDLTYVQTKVWQDGTDTFSCTTEGGWKWRSPAGDTLTLVEKGDRARRRRMLVRGQELLRWGDELGNIYSLGPSYVYRRVVSSGQP